MYYIKKTIEISASHQLHLNYESKCQQLHGHNWLVTIYCKAAELDENGMVVDFTHIKKNIADRLDHSNLNEILPFNPTAENMARWICDQIPTAYRVDVVESQNNEASYERDED